MQRSFLSSLSGRVRNFTLPKSTPLVPLYEAVVNSFNAIEERAARFGYFSGKIEIEVVRNRSLFEDSSNDTISGFNISDNGIGFTDENMTSFMEADSEHKISIGGKGVGRFSWLKAFSSVNVISTYNNSGSDIDFVTRTFTFSLDAPGIEDTVESASCCDYRTTVKLVDYRNDYIKKVPKRVESIAKNIIQHCFVFFLSDACPEIEIFDEYSRLSLNQLYREIYLIDENTSTFYIGSQKFTLLNIKINDKSFEYKNQICFCANARLVKTEKLEKVIVDLSSKIFDNEGYWYLGVLTGNYLDQNVDMNRLSFSIPPESDPLFPESPGFDDIFRSATQSVKNYLAPYLERVQNDKIKRIEKYVTEVAPQYRHLLHYARDEISKLDPDLQDDKLDDALNRIKRNLENTANAECKELMNRLEHGNISSEEYQDQFQQTIQKVSDINSAALAEYVVHRRIILNLFRCGFRANDDGKFNLEQYMHQLIYPMRTTSDELPYRNHNLWLIDEKLSFVQFISSDKPFNNSPGEKRADILALDYPVAVAETENTGVEYGSITIFELKRPGRDDYSMGDNPITQLIAYAKKLRRGEVKDNHRRPIRVSTTTQFYLYAVCDITDTLVEVLETLDFSRTPDGLGAFGYNKELKAHIEVLSYDKIMNDSEKRNKVLFENLGLRN